MQEPYEPARKVHQRSSRKKYFRFMDPISKTERHLAGDIEKAWFLLFWYSVEVVDIKEQVGLDLTKTIAIANQSGCKHPIKRTNKKVDYDPIVTTFLVTKDVNGRRWREAFSYCKQKQQSENSTQNRLEIERRYWKHFDIPHATLTEQNVSLIKAINIDLLLRHYDLSMHNISPVHIAEIHSCVRDCLGRNSCSFNGVSTQVASHLSISQGIVTIALYNLIAHHHIHADLDYSNNPQKWLLCIKETD